MKNFFVAAAAAAVAVVHSELYYNNLIEWNGSRAL